MQASASDKALARWTQLDNDRSSFLKRLEKYALLTLPRLLPEESTTQNSTELVHDYQSVGAQSVTHLVNKMMLALFAPSRPFFRLGLSTKFKQSLVSQGVTEAIIDTTLANGERQAAAELDKRPIRAKLYEVLSSLVVLGNSLLYLPKDRDDQARVFSIRDYVVRRTGDGRVKEIIVRERLKFDELDEAVQAAVVAQHKPDDKVNLLHWIVLEADGSYSETTWVDDERLPPPFDGAYPEAQNPWRVLAWALADKNDYGTGYVEDYAGDFSALSMLSRSVVEGAILASQFKWLANPAGITRPDEFEKAENGAVLPGVKGDLELVSNSKPGDLQVVQGVAQDYIQRIGRGFLLGSAVTRQAERVTAEEMRQQAQELETTLGGVYSQIAIDLQSPIARWLLALIEVSIQGTQLEVSIITGLDALSRNGDLSNLRGALADAANLQALGPLLDRIDDAAVLATIFAGWGLDPDKYVLSQDAYQQRLQARQDAAAQEAAATAGAQAGAAAAMQP